MADTTALAAAVANLQTARDTAVAAIAALRASDDQAAVDSATSAIQQVADTLNAAAAPPTA